MPTRHLPPFPDYAKEVETPEPQAGENEISVAARERAAKAEANGIIRNLRVWYKDVRTAYGQSR